MIRHLGSRMAWLTAALCLSLLSAPVTAVAQCETQTFALPGQDGPAQFGAAVVWQGGLGALGAPLHAGPGETKEGTVTPLAWQAGVWVAGAPFQGFDTDMDDLFGARLALDGDTLAVGAYTHDHDDLPQGAVFVFRHTAGTWVQEAEVLSTQVFSSDNQFGWSIALDGDVLVVGSGREAWAEVFRRSGTTWSHEQTLADPDNDYVNQFGRDVALDGGHLLVSDLSTSGGQLHAYEWDGLGWTFVETLQSPEAADGDSFGSGLCLAGDELLVGAPGADGAGAVWAHVWDGGAWQVGQKLVAPGGLPGDRFGWSLSADGDLLAVGAPRADGGLGGGRVQQFRRVAGVWVATTSITAPGVPLELGDEFGRSLAVQDGSILVAAPFDDAPVSGGVVWVLPADAAWIDLGHALAGLHGEPSLTASGNLAGGCPVSCRAAGALEITSAALIFGLEQLDAPFKGGVLVPHPTWLLPLLTDSVGSVELTTIWPAGLPSGIPLLLQFWFVDPAGPVGFSASNALKVTTP